MQKTRTFRAALIAAAACFSMSVHAVADSPRQLNIPPGELAAALDALARQSGVELMYSSALVNGLQTDGLQGEYTAEDAAHKLLAGTRLKLRIHPSGALLISASNGPADSASEPATATPSGAQSQKVIELEEVLVTGTLIRGSAPVGSDLDVYTWEDIQRTGAATLDQFGRTMTQNLASVDQIANDRSSSGKFGPGTAAGNNFGGSAFNLRGVGTSATLTLLNGNRLPAAGLTGALTDISLIPLSAIERIEVLADGASAIYGADAVAGVVNIITRNDFSGAQTSARFGGTTDGGGAQYSASQLLGTDWERGNVMLTYQFNQQEDLEASQRSYIPDQGGRHALIPESRTHSVLTAIRQELGSSSTLSGSAFYTDREGTFISHIDNLFLVSDLNDTQKVSLLGGSLRLEQKLSGDWNASLSGHYSRVRQTSLILQNMTGGFSAGQLAVSSQRASSDVYGADLLVNGTLAELPAGDLKVALGASHREERFENFSGTAIFVNGIELFSSGIEVPDLDRYVNSAFGEVRLPLLGSASSEPRLEISGAVRHDDYDDFGSATTWKGGLSWSVMSGLRVRATYGTSFKAPSLVNLGEAQALYAIPGVPDLPLGTFTNAVEIYGGNPQLQPEEAKSFTAGFDIEPALLPTLRLRISYFDIDYTDRIDFPRYLGSYLQDPAVAGYVTRSPSPAQVNALFANPGFLDFCGCTADQIGAIADLRNTNLASTRQSGFDFNAAYTVLAAHGDFELTLSAQRLLKNDSEALAGQPVIEYLNTFAQPPKFKGRGGLSWTNRGFNASFSVNYVNSYRNGIGATIANPNGSPDRIDSFTTADVYLSYRTGEAGSAGLLRNLTTALSINNLTDEQPPVVIVPVTSLLPGQRYLPFDAVNASPLGRFISLQVTKNWQ